MTTEEIYKQGVIDGMTCFAWWKDGVQQVGTTGSLLSDRIKDPEKQWNYGIPEEGIHGK